jgi:Sec-independent protein translocase protein TatA
MPSIKSMLVIAVVAIVAIVVAKRLPVVSNYL